MLEANTVTWNNNSSTVSKARQIPTVAVFSSSSHAPYQTYRGYLCVLCRSVFRIDRSRLCVTCPTPSARMYLHFIPALTYHSADTPSSKKLVHRIQQRLYQCAVWFSNCQAPCYSIISNCFYIT